MSVQSMGEVGKDFCPNFLQSFLENIDRRSCDDGGWQLIPIFKNHNQHQLWDPRPSCASPLPRRPLDLRDRTDEVGNHADEMRLAV